VIELNSRWHRTIALGAIWLLQSGCDRLWFALDRSVPDWDRADYLTGALNYADALEHPHWFSGEWWTNLWLLSSKIPPGTYLATAVIHQIFGTGSDRATLVNLLFSAILLASTYGLGRILFNPKIGLWAAALCTLFPAFYRSRLDFLLDYPLTATVTLAFFCLTLWRSRTHSPRLHTRPPSRFKLPPTLEPWLWAAAFGMASGLALMVKQTALLFLSVPLLWAAIASFKGRKWSQCGQLSLSVAIAALVIYPWYRTNWLLILTGSKRATVDAAIAEGDPSLTSLDAWTYYAEQLPNHVSWLLAIVAIVGFLLYYRRRQKNLSPSPVPHPWRWLAVYLLGAYFFASVNINKDFRYVLPYLPVVAIALAYGLSCWRGKWARSVRWGTLGIAVLLVLNHLFSWGFTLPGSALLGDRADRRPYTGPPWPHPEAIAEIINTSPYLQTTVGVLPSTPEINQHNVNYYGALADFQVYGRQVGTRLSQVDRDMRSLDWFVTKTGDPGSVPEDAYGAISAAIAQNPDLILQREWTLPIPETAGQQDPSTLQLYRRQPPGVAVEPIADRSPSLPVRLDRAIVPPASPPGVPVPVTYYWSGPWEPLQRGLAIVTWENDNGDLWLHDRAIAGGRLYSQIDTSVPVRVVDRTAMLPPADLPPGVYRLQVTYLNRETGEIYPIAAPEVSLTIDENATPTPAPELDWVTQLRSLSQAMPRGPDALGPVFEEVARINQYDPVQDYLAQAARSLEYRLQSQPERLDFIYNLTLARVLQRDPQGAIAALKRATVLDAQNPYAHAYLAFVYLYDWQPRSAREPLDRAFALAPDLEVLQLLSAVSYLMQGNLFGVWSQVEGFLPDRLKTILAIAFAAFVALSISALLSIFVLHRRRFGRKRGSKSM
jgi:4-amino-4-deoxy-L-arabinose transferase-like glycosyltransferase